MCETVFWEFWPNTQLQPKFRACLVPVATVQLVRLNVEVFCFVTVMAVVTLCCCSTYLPSCLHSISLSLLYTDRHVVGSVWALEHCRIIPPGFLTECRKKRLNQASFVLLYFVLFAFSGLCLVFVMCLFLICLLSCIFQHVPT